MPLIPESAEIPYVIGVVVLMIIVLIIDKFKASMVFLFAMALVLLGGIIPVGEFISGLSNTAILTIFLLIIVTASINEHFNLTAIFEKGFGRTRTARSFILKMSASVAGVSAFMNNTPVVAVMMPYVYSWGKKYQVSPSRLLIPLSYAAIAGGMITLIGTSTNLVLNGLLEANGLETLQFSDFIVPGVLVTVGCVLFMYTFSPAILKDHKDLLEVFEENSREYIVETVIVPGATIAGLTVEEAGLRNLKGVFLAEIVRSKKQITPVNPYQTLEEGDILLFAGETSTIFDLLKNGKGLELSQKEKFNIADNTELKEAVVAQNSVLDRKTVKEAGFREKYDAAIIGIHRRGEKLNGKIGSVEIHTGDLLLLTTGPDFDQRNRKNGDLIVINTLKPASDFSSFRKKVFLTGLAGAVILAAAGFIRLFEALLLITFIQLLLGMISLEKIKKNISFDLLVVLITALALGQALIESGAANYITGLFFGGAQEWHPVWLLGGIFLATFILTSFITNVAAISIIFPVVYSIMSATDGIPGKALFLTAAFAASCCFVTPFAYQTNLMVMEAGNYRFMDFVRMGLPTSLIYAAIFMIYIIYKFNIL